PPGNASSTATSTCANTAAAPTAATATSKSTTSSPSLKAAPTTTTTSRPSAPNPATQRKPQTKPAGAGPAEPDNDPRTDHTPDSATHSDRTQGGHPSPHPKPC